MPPLKVISDGLWRGLGVLSCSPPFTESCGEGLTVEGGDLVWVDQDPDSHQGGPRCRIDAMFDPQMHLLTSVLSGLLDDTEPEDAPKATWADASEAISSLREEETELAALIDAQDTEALKAILQEIHAGKRHLPSHDREVLKRAMKAYRKSLKVTILAAESSLGGGPMSGGRHSSICGITPPARYPESVWRELVRQGRLVAGGRGIYELPPGA